MFEDLLDHWYSYSRKKFWGPLILIFIFSVILALSIVGVIYLINPNLLEATNSYSIQKEVCRNETYYKFYSFPNDFVLTNCPKNLTLTDCYDKNNRLILNVKCKIEGNCYYLKNHSSKDILFVEEGEITYSDYPMYIFHNIPYVIKNQTTEETCTYEESDEIEKEVMRWWNEDDEEPYHEFECNNLDVEHHITRCFNGTLRESKYGKGYLDSEQCCYAVYTAKELTTEWLEENCNKEFDCGIYKVTAGNNISDIENCKLEYYSCQFGENKYLITKN